MILFHSLIIIVIYLYLLCSWISLTEINELLYFDLFLAAKLVPDFRFSKLLL